MNKILTAIIACMAIVIYIYNHQLGVEVEYNKVQAEQNSEQRSYIETLIKGCK